MCVTPPLLFYTLGYIDKYSPVLIWECPSRLCCFDVTAIELGLIQTQIAQKQILRVEVYDDQVKRQRQLVGANLNTRAASKTLKVTK